MNDKRISGEERLTAMANGIASSKFEHESLLSSSSSSIEQQWIIQSSFKLFALFFIIFSVRVHFYSHLVPVFPESVCLATHYTHIYYIRLKTINSIQFTCLVSRLAKNVRSSAQEEENDTCTTAAPAAAATHKSVRKIKHNRSSRLILVKFDSFFVVVRVCVWYDIIVYCLIHSTPKRLPGLFSSVSLIVRRTLSPSHSLAQSLSMLIRMLSLPLISRRQNTQRKKSNDTNHTNILAYAYMHAYVFDFLQYSVRMGEWAELSWAKWVLLNAEVSAFR